MPAKQISPVVLNTLGTAGLNTQAQESTLGPEFLTEATNVVFDYQGRITSRKGIKQVSKLVTATAKVNGATSNTTTLVVDNNSGTILSGMTVTGTGISGTVTVASLSDQNNLVLSTNQSLSDNVDLTFTLISDVKSIGEFIKSDRTREYFAAMGSNIFKIGTSATPHTMTLQSFANSPQTITQANWQFFNFNKEMWGVQTGHKPINYDGTNWSDVDDLGAYVAPAGVTTFDPSCAVAGFSRIWYGGVTEAPGTVFYSDNLIGEKLNGGAAGSIDLNTVWGNDEIVGFATLENKLVIFGKETIVIYKKADDPSNIELDEIIRGVGLAGRDNIVYVNTDVVFMSYEGLRAVSRTVANDGKSPIDDLSLMVRNDLTRILSTVDVSTIKSTYYPQDGFVVTFIPINNQCYVFDFAQSQRASNPRITTWSFTDGPSCGLSTLDGKLFIGTKDSVAEYDGYYDVSINASDASTNTSYDYIFQTSWLDLGSPATSKIVKSGIFTIVGGRGGQAQVAVYKDYDIGSPFTKTFNLVSAQTIFLYGKSDALYGAAKYASTVGPTEYKIALARTGKTIKLKMTNTVAGNYSSLVNTMLLTKQGKIR